MSENKRLVILGGGASGILLSMKLAKTAGIDIILIDNKTFYEYTPGLCSVVYEKTNAQFENHFKKITFDYHEFLQKLSIQFILGKVTSIQDDSISIANQSESIKFDYLVICTGSSYADPWKTVSESHAPLDHSTRFENLRQHREKYLSSQHILCIGGGPVGIEIATEMANRSPSKQITLVDKNEIVLSSAPNSLGKVAQDIIQSNYSKQIQLITSQSCSPKGESMYETDETHQSIQADLVYNCIGVKPNSFFIDKSWLNEKGQIVVNQYFQVDNKNHIFALGDVNSMEEPKMYYTAHMQAIHFANNFPAILNGNTANLTPYQGVKPNMVISMGPSYGIGNVAGIKFTGLVSKKGSKMAAILKHLIEKISMDDFGSKLIFNEILYYAQKNHHQHQS